MLGTFSGDLQAWATLVTAAGASTAAVLSALNRRTGKVTERKVEEGAAVAADAAGTVADLHPKIDTVITQLGSHEEQLRHLRTLAGLARPFMADWEERHGSASLGGGEA